MVTRPLRDVRGPRPAAEVSAGDVLPPQPELASVVRPALWAAPDSGHRLRGGRAHTRGAAPPSWRPGGCPGKAQRLHCTPGVHTMMTACLPALAPRGHIRGQDPDAPGLGALRARLGAPRADDRRPTHPELPGHVACRAVLCVKRSDVRSTCEPARPPFLAGDLVRGGAAERARLNGRGAGARHRARGQQGGQASMEPIQQPFESFAQIADQMPPIENLLGLWGSQGSPARRLR